MAVAPCCGSSKTQSLIRASAQTGYWGSDPRWTDPDYCLPAKSFALLARSLSVSAFLCVFISPGFPAEEQQLKPKKRLICWAKEVYKWARWNISYLRLSKCRCLISHISDWRLWRCHAQLKKPSCQCSRWSQYDIHWIRRADRKIRWRYLYIQPHLQSIHSPCGPLSETQVIKAVTKKQSHSQRCSSNPLGSRSRNEAWHRRRSETKQGSAAPERGRWSLTLCVSNNGWDQARCAVTSVKHWSRWLAATGEHSQEPRVLSVSSKQMTEKGSQSQQRRNKIPINRRTKTKSMNESSEHIESECWCSIKEC